MSKQGNFTTHLLTKHTKITASCTKDAMPIDESSNENSKKDMNYRIYHDETLMSFFRRLSFSPNGSILLATAGIYRDPTTKECLEKEVTKNTVYIYSRGNLLGYVIIRFFI